MDSSQLQPLRELVAKHRVVYERRLAQVVQEGTLVTIGYDVALLGTFSEGADADTWPGDGPGHHVWQDLEQIALAIVPASDELTRVTIAPFSPSVHFAQVRQKRPDIELLIELRHRHHYNDPLDAAEETCFKQLLADLTELGIMEKRWQGHPHH